MTHYLKTRPGAAAVMSLILPGVGQIYTGRWIWAVFFFIFTPGFWLGSGGTLGWVFHIWSAWHAHKTSNYDNAKLRIRGV